MTEHFEVLDAKSYYQALIDHLPKAQKRILLASMVLLSGPKLDRLFDGVEQALKRGVAVTILLDVFSARPGLSGIKQATGRWQQTVERLAQLESQGATIYRWGRIGLIPFGGRCHVKATVIDNQVFSFGSLNLHDEAFKAINYMIGIKSQAYADYHVQLIDRIGRHQPPLSDEAVDMGHGYEALFDGGQPGKSVIYDHACQLAAKAKRVWYASQITPSGRLVRLLKQTSTTYLTNRPSAMRPLPFRIIQALDLARYRTPNSYHGQDFLHIKLILFELKTGQKVLISGSHNYSYRSVVHGTQEIALESTDEHLWQQLYDFWQSCSRAGRN